MPRRLKVAGPYPESRHSWLPSRREVKTVLFVPDSLGCLEHSSLTSRSLMMTKDTYLTTRGWAACYFAMIFSATFLGLATFANDRVDDEARTATTGCPDALKRTEKYQTFETGMCLGYSRACTTSARMSAFRPPLALVRWATSLPDISIATRTKFATISRKRPLTPCAPLGLAVGKTSSTSRYLRRGGSEPRAL